MFNFLKKLLQFSNDLEKISKEIESFKKPKPQISDEKISEISKSAVESFIESGKSEYEKMRDDYQNPTNHSTAKQMKYSLLEKLEKTPDAELTIFEENFFKKFAKMKVKLKDEDFMMVEKYKLYRDENIFIGFYRHFFQVFKSLASRYKKAKNLEKYEEIFVRMYHEAELSGQNMIEILNMTDFRALAKIFKKQWNDELLEKCENFDKKMQKNKEEEFDKNLQWAIEKNFEKLFEYEKFWYKNVRLQTGQCDFCAKLHNKKLTFKQAEKYAQSNSAGECGCPIYFFWWDKN